jgi:hypothetical protein
MEFSGSQGQGVIKVRGDGANPLGELGIKNSIIDGINGDETYARGVYVESGTSQAYVKIENTSFYNIGSNYIKIEDEYSGSIDATYNFFDQAEPDGQCNECTEDDACNVFSGNMFSGLNVQSEVAPWYFEDPQEIENASLVVQDCEDSYGGGSSWDCVGEMCASDCQVDQYVGDGYCDDGEWGFDFGCEEWNFLDLRDKALSR